MFILFCLGLLLTISKGIFGWRVTPIVVTTRISWTVITSQTTLILDKSCVGGVCIILAEFTFGEVGTAIGPISLRTIAITIFYIMRNRNYRMKLTSIWNPKLSQIFMYLIIIQINLNILFFNVPHMSNCTYQSLHSYRNNYNTKDNRTKGLDHFHG